MKLDSRDQLIIHIEGLQATLTKRNAQIEQLRKELNKPIVLPDEIQKELDKAFIKGWKACAIRIHTFSHEAKQNLMKLSDASSAAYWLEKDKQN